MQMKLFDVQMAERILVDILRLYLHQEVCPANEVYAAVVLFVFRFIFILFRLTFYA